MSEAIFKKNLAAVAKRNPNLAKRIVREPIPNELKIIKTNSRYPTLALQLKEKLAFFHSKDNPVKEARGQFANYAADPTVNICVLGAGLGYHIAELANYIVKENYLIIVEQYLPIFKLAIMHTDLTQILSNKHCMLFVDARPQHIFEALKQQIFQIANNKIVFLKHDTSCLIFRDYYSQVESGMRDLIHWGKTNFAAGVRFRYKYQENIFKNAPYFFTRPGIDHIEDEFFSVPAIIVAAGPSLEKNIELLKQAKGRALIISVDTAFKPLLMRGIEPDLVIAIDPHEENFMHFEKVSSEEVKDTRIVLDPQTYFKIPEKYPDKVLIPALNGSVLVGWLNSFAKKRCGIDKGMSVAHSAFSLAQMLGCDPVVFVGLDLSFREDATHIKGAANFKSSASDRKLRKVKGLLGGEVFTDDVFFAYIKHFEVEFSKASCKVINATEGGAFIGGMEIMPLKRVIDEVLTEEVNIPDLLLNEHPARFDLEKFNKGVESVLSDIEWSRKLAQSAINSKTSGIERVRQLKRAYETLKQKRLVMTLAEENIEEAAFLLTLREFWHRQGMAQEDSDIKKLELYLDKFIKSLNFLEGHIITLRDKVLKEAQDNTVKKS